MHIDVYESVLVQGVMEKTDCCPSVYILFFHSERILVNSVVIENKDQGFQPFFWEP